MDMAKVGKRIKEKRVAMDMTQEQLAERTDLRAAYVGMLERGKRTPSLESFIAISDELGTTTDELLFGIAKKAYVTRLADYEDKLANLRGSEADKVFGVLDILLK